MNADKNKCFNPRLSVFICGLNIFFQRLVLVAGNGRGFAELIFR
jgi:hypothetical protein